MTLIEINRTVGDETFFLATGVEPCPARKIRQLIGAPLARANF